MRKNIIGYLKKNLVTIICLIVIIIYLFVNFQTNRERLLYLACIILLCGSLLFYVSFFGNIFIDKFSLRDTLELNYIEIIVLIIAMIIVYFLGSPTLLGGLLLGNLLFGLMVFGYYYFKY